MRGLFLVLSLACPLACGGGPRTPCDSNSLANDPELCPGLTTEQGMATLVRTTFVGTNLVTLSPRAAPRRHGQGSCTIGS
jgi:hypothetical protein